MHLAYIVSQYPAVSHTFIQREILGLRQLGHSITTISVRPPNPKDLLTETDKAEARLTHVLLPPNPLKLLVAIASPLFLMPGRFFRAAGAARRLRRPGIRGALWIFFYFLEALLVHRRCVKEGISHLHAHFANVASDVAMIATVLNGGTFSFTMHGPTEFFDLRDHRLAEKAAAARFIVCISDFARSQMMALLPPEQWSKLEVVHCGVDPAQFSHAKSKIKNEKLTLLCVARLTAVKGHPILLHALAELTNRGHDLALTVVGDGPLRDSLEKSVDTLGLTDRVRFRGNVGQHVIHELYAAADLFVLPSFAEGVPVVLMEAMAARCPVIATRIAGIPELIEHGVSGLLVSPGRPDLLADAIERILVGPAAAHRMAAVAHDRIAREFNLHKIAPQLAAIFDRHLTSARAVRSFLAAAAPVTETPPEPVSTLPRGAA